MSKFVKKGELTLVNGGYLSIGKKGEVIPVSNVAFEEVQKHAEYIVTFAKLAKGKDFVGKAPETLGALVEEVQRELAKKDTVYVAIPAMPARSINDQFAAEALAWHNGGKEQKKAQLINEYMQQFNVIQEFEEFGLFFNDGVAKLNKIYTVEEITAAVKDCIDLLK
jgi:hypothetical protein